jgi:hypothetical protein
MIRKALLISCLFAATGAYAQTPAPLNCAAFRHNEDGSWTPLEQVQIQGPKDQSR